jgi:hypothetical protein
MAAISASKAAAQGMGFELDTGPSPSVGTECNLFKVTLQVGPKAVKCNPEEPAPG